MSDDIDKKQPWRPADEHAFSSPQQNMRSERVRLFDLDFDGPNPRPLVIDTLGWLPRPSSFSSSARQLI